MTGQALPEYIGKRYATIKERDDQELDVLVRTKTGHQVRLLRKLNPHPNSNRDPEKPREERYVCLRTSIGRDRLSVAQIFQIYRGRWMC